MSLSQTEQQIFHNLASQWQTVTNLELTLLHANGQVLLGPAEAQVAIPSDEPLPPNIVPTRGESEALYVLVPDLPTPHQPLLHIIGQLFQSQCTQETTLQGMTDELIIAWNQLELIYHVTQAMVLADDLEEALRGILAKMYEVVGVEDCFIILNRVGHLEQFIHKATIPDTALDASLLTALQQHDSVVLNSTPQECQQLWPSVPQSINTLLATKLAISSKDQNSETTAALGLVNKQSQAFTASDVKLVGALAYHIGILIQNFVHNQQQIQAERDAREREITIEIQENFTPQNVSQVRGLSFAVFSKPAEKAGGDFYDFVNHEDGRLSLVIGDVAGKGVAAVTLTTVLRAVLRSELRRGEPPHQVLTQVNAFLAQELSQLDAVITALVIEIDPNQHTLRYANAGHIPGLCYHSDTDTVVQLRATSPPLNALGVTANESVTIHLSTSDTIVLYTDGITQTRSPRDEAYGVERLQALVKNYGNEPPEQLQQYIQHQLAQFRLSPTARDDMTMLVVKTLPQTDVLQSKNISTIVKMETLNFQADTGYLTEMLEAIMTLCRQIPRLETDNKAQDFLYLVELAVSELCTNIIRHAYKGRPGDIKIQVAVLSNGIQIDFYDQGDGFDPSKVPTPKTTPDTYTEGGYGLHIIRQIMDVVTYEHDPVTGNHWRLMKLVQSGS